MRNSHLSAAVPVLLAAIFMLASPVRAEQAESVPATAAAAAATEAAETAEESAPTTQPDPAAVLAGEAERLIAAIKESEATLKEDTDKYEEAEGEDQLVILTQLWRSREVLLEQLYELVDNVLEREEAGFDAAAHRKYTEAAMARVSKAIRRHTDGQLEEASRLRSEREAVSPEDQVALEGLITKANERLDLLFSLMLKHTRKLERMGLTEEAAADREFLVDRIAAFAKSLGGRIEYLRDQVAQLEQRVAQFPDDAGASSQLQNLEQRLDARTVRLANTIKLMKQLDLDTAEYGQLIIQTTGKVTTDVFERDVALGLLQQWIGKVQTSIVENGPGWVFNVLAFVLIVLVSRLLARIMKRVVERALSASKLRFSRLLQNMIASVAGNLVLILGIMIGLGQLGVELGPVLAGLGIAGFIVGFALQETLGNFAAGVMILGYRPYDEGDIVEVGGVFGKVANMSLVTTRILTFDNQEVFVPNGKIWGEVIRNVTAQRIRRVDMEFGISYADDVEQAEIILKDILDKHERVLKDPAPLVKLHKLGESSVDFVVRPWAKTVDYWDVYWDVTREVKMRFDKEGISIPFPQRDVHLYRAAD